MTWTAMTSSKHWPRPESRVTGSVPHNRIFLSFVANPIAPIAIGTTDEIMRLCGTDPGMEGAGGIGGLLARSSGYSAGNWTTNHFYHADGNGNITYLVDASQAMAATYRYDPFGNTISSSGSLAGANLYRFSSKEVHVNTGMYIYLYRFYDPSVQRWPNRDPLGGSPDIQLRIAQGDIYKLNPWESVVGPNLYEYVYNSPLNFIDPDGLWGIGVTGGASAEAGVGYGAAGTISVGGGVFGGGARGVNLGGYESERGFSWQSMRSV